MSVELLDISVYRKAPAKAPKPVSQEWTTVRILPDGISEQVGPRGRRRRIRLVECVECESPKAESEFAYRSNGGSGLSDGICIQCWLSVQRRQNAKARQDARAALTVLYAAVLERAHEFGSAERRAAIVRFASPEWRDRKAIAQIYAEARRLSAETGQPHDVDHFYPLQSSICCGLHVAANLRIVKASTNRAKGNTFPLDHSPAFHGMRYAEICKAVHDMILGLD